MTLSFTELFSSPVWLRFILALGLLGFTQTITRQYAVPFAKGLRLIPIVYLVRELIGFFFPIAGIFNLSDAIAYAILALWLADYSGRPKTADILKFLAPAIIIVLEALGLILGISSLMRIIQSILLAAFVAYIGVLMNDLSVYNARHPEFIIENRAVLFLALFIPRAALIFTPTMEGTLAQAILLPAVLVSYFLIVFLYQRFFHNQTVEKDEFNTSYINSLFDFMRTIGSAMTQRIEVKSILEYVVKTISSHSNAEAGAVFLRDAQANVLTLGVVQGYYPPPFPVPAIVKQKLSGVERYFESTPIKVGETVLGEAAADNTPVYIRNTDEDPRMSVNTKDDTLYISSFMAVPLVVNQEVYGILSIIHRERSRLFSPLDYERFKIFAEYASLTLDSLYNYSQLLEKQEIEREVNIAGDIQKKLLPSRVPKRIKKNIAAFSQPAKGVSGDYYDIIPLSRSGRLGMVICDVAGKGVPASLIMVMIRTIVHLIAGSTKDASKVVTWINRGIAGSIDIERFATLSYFTYDPDTHQLEYSNAGHHPLIVHRTSDKAVERVDSPGLPIGLEREAKYERRTVELHPGDVVMVYTDGIIEAMNPEGEQYEEERLQTVFRDNAQKDADEILTAIRSDIERFVGPAKQHDDQTLIIMKA